MKQIKLTKGYFALVDDDSYAFLSKWRWYAGGEPTRYYAYRHVNFPAIKRGQAVAMHHLVLGMYSPQRYGLNVDHIDGNSLNNQLSNLRVVTTRENSQNLKSHRSGKLVGTTYCHKKRKFRARIRFKDKQVFLGAFDSAIEGYTAYKIALAKIANGNEPR